MAEPGGYQFPYFHSYPPWFTLQPVKETRDRQTALWCDLILHYCRQCKVYKLSTSAADPSPLFSNPGINRRLSREAKLVFLGALVQQGNALWLDSSQQQCLVLWHTVRQWADLVAGWAKAYAVDVTTVEELSSGDEVQGTELAGAPRELMMEALLLLERSGKARVFRGNAGDDAGVKFFV